LNLIKWKYFLIVLIFLPIISIAQTFEGKISNAEGFPISNANIVLQDTIGKDIAFSFSDDDGNFVINYKSEFKNFYLIVNAFNYESVKQKISRIIKTQNFILTDKIIELKEVNVKPPAIGVNGDTTNYSVDFFKKPQNRVIGDVLRNIPGISISDKGAISYNGISINKFYIDGDDILGGKYNLAQNTIPADLVESVQVFERHQPIEVLRKITSSQQPAINLKLKDGAKFKLLGEGELTAGNYDNYVANANTMLLSNKLKSINRLAFNSAANELKVELEDHSLENFFENLKIPFSFANYSYQNVQDPIIGLQRWQKNYTGIVNFNALIKIKEKQSVKVNIGYIPEKSFKNYQKQTNYIFADQLINQYEQQALNDVDHLIKGGLIFEKNNEKIFITNNLSAEFDLNATTGNVFTNDGSLKQIGLANKSKLTNDFRFVKVIFKKIALNYKSYLGYQAYPENSNITNNLFLLNQVQNGKDLDQNIQKNIFFINQKLSLGFNTKNIRQNYSVNVDYDDGNYTQNIFANNLILDANYRNDLSFKKLRNNIEANYIITANKFKFNLNFPLNFNMLRYNDLL
jgi:hypothetical protein